MRQESTIKVEVRGVVIGGSRFLTCLPLVAEDYLSAVEGAREMVSLKPDLLEWRVDAIKDLTDSDKLLAALRKIRIILGQIPLIFTCRSEHEGGLQKISQEQRFHLIETVVKTGQVDIIDIELCNDDPFIDAVIKSVRSNDTKLILSHHNFTETPGEEFIFDKLLEAQDHGADIAKIAVMPKDYSDVLSLLAATNRARSGPVQIPMITISMGEEGAITRQAGGLFGSDVTFGAGAKSSAPGQIPMEKLQKIIELVY